MAEGTKLTDVLNTGKQFEYRGQTYTVTDLDAEQLAIFSAWLENRAKLAALRVKDAPDEAAKNGYAAVCADAAMGLYEPGGEYFFRACYTLTGLTKLWQLLLKKHHPELTEGFVQNLILDRHQELTPLLVDAVGDLGKALSAQSASSPTGPKSSPGSRSTAKSRSKTRKRSR